jgi:tryptophanyl-tRNA synthetase
MGLDDPTVKMSKSTALTKPAHAILLLDPPDTVRKKIGRATTDTNPAVAEPVGPGVANLLDMYAALHGTTHEQAVAEFAGRNYGTLKSAATDAINEALAPIQALYRTIRGDEPWLLGVLAEAAERAAPVANATLLRVQRAVGLR